MLGKKILLAATVFGLTTSAAFATGAYVGADIGIKANTSKSGDARGMPVNVYAGFGGEVANGIYLAAEIFGVPVTGVISDYGLRSTYGYGASFIPGVMISDHTLGYMRFGLVRSRFTPSGVRSQTETGGQVGLGLQTSLMQNWDLRGEYVYTAYNDISGVSGSPRSDEFNLGLVYKFD